MLRLSFTSDIEAACAREVSTGYVRDNARTNGAGFGGSGILTSTIFFIIYACNLFSEGPS
jgi:hypothetical protein